MVSVSKETLGLSPRQLQKLMDQWDEVAPLPISSTLFRRKKEQETFRVQRSYKGLRRRPYFVM